nr:MAG TPA: hypothetical protein [Caudoviricetes sp.]
MSEVLAAVSNPVMCLFAILMNRYRDYKKIKKVLALGKRMW